MFLFKNELNLPHLICSQDRSPNSAGIMVSCQCSLCPDDSRINIKLMVVQKCWFAECAHEVKGDFVMANIA